METTLQITQKIQERLGFIPPFFKPSLGDPFLLKNLWFQTENSYLDNPLPHLLKEKIAALLARYCPVSYCLFCHTASLSPLGMTGEAILKLMMTESPTSEKIRERIRTSSLVTSRDASKLDPETEALVLDYVTAIYLHIESDFCHRQLQKILNASDYQYLVLFICYNRTALSWAEGNPEISYQDDKRVLDHLDRIVKEEPGLTGFLSSYREMFETPEGVLLKKFHQEKASLNEIITQKSLEVDEQRAIALNHAKLSVLGEMASSIAHEIRNPLAVLNSSLMMIEKLNPERDRELLTQQYSSLRLTVKRIDDIVESLHFYSKEPGQDTRKNVSLKEIFEKTLPLCQHKIFTAGCQLSVKMPSEDVSVYCNPISISQALLNLLSNALDAVEDQANKWIRVECLSLNDKLEIHVIDSGKKIPEEIRSKIMTPFFTTKSNSKGTGLGLTIVNKIMQSHNGYLKLAEDTEHTCFTLHLTIVTTENTQG